MTDKPIISATIVLYRNDISTLKKTVDSFLDIPLTKILYLVDNSPNNSLKAAFLDKEIEYIYVGKNIGFGSAQNRAIQKIKNRSTYHLVLNPDVIFKGEVVLKLIKAIEQKPDIALIAPKVLYNNGKHQYSCRKYPSMIELLARKISFLGAIFSKRILKGNYQDNDLNSPFNVEYLTGCFMLFKTVDFVSIKGFDERYFLYMEDVDICRKLDNINKKKRYYPHEKIYHTLERGSSKNIKLFLHHNLSVFQYFYKWGITNKKAN